MASMPTAGDDGNPIRASDFIGLAPGGTSPDSLSTFKEHLLQMFSVDYGGDDETIKSNAWTFVSMSHGLFYNGHHSDGVIDAFVEELVKRLESKPTEDWSNPLLNALYVTAGEFLGLMKTVEHQLYLSDHARLLGGSR